VSTIGNRAQILIEDTGIRLYTHWHGSEAPDILAKALSHEKRWHQPGYLSRIIFEEMLEYATDDYTGFGIQDRPVAHANVIKVNCEYRTVVYNCDEYSFQEFAERAETEEVAE